MRREIDSPLISAPVPEKLNIPPPHKADFSSFSSDSWSTTMEDEHETSTLHASRKKSSMRLSCCFNTHHRRAGSFDISSSIMPSPSRRSPSSWIRSKAPELPEIKGRYKNFMSRMGKHRRHSSADFSYDPLSYALNFEDNDDPPDGEDPVRNFSSRLPASPPGATIVASAPSRGKMLSVSVGTSELPASKAAAVAEVVKNLELSPSPPRAAEMRRNLELPTLRTAETRRNLESPTPRRPSSDVSRRSADQVSEVRSSLEVPTQRKAVEIAEASRSIKRSTPRAAAVAEVRRSLEDVTHSRRVLVELC